MRVFINPGHCPGADPGAIGQSGVQEAAVVLDVGERLAAILGVVGIDTSILQSDDLSDVCAASDAFNADMFVSLHCNAAVNAEAEGTETFYHPGSENGRALTECVHAQLVGLGLTDRGTKDGSWLYVVKNTSAPAILVELDFISNPEQEQYLADDNNKQELARAIARGITDYQGAMA